MSDILHNLRPVYRTDEETNIRDGVPFEIVGFDMIPAEESGGDHPEPVFFIKYEGGERPVPAECVFTGYDPQFDQWCEQWRPAVGLYVRDRNLSLYRIIDERHTNTHAQGASEFLVECLKGPHTGRTMWLGRSTIESGDFPLRFVTYTTNENNDPQALTEAEFRDPATKWIDLDLADWVWQFAPDKATAIAQHETKLDLWRADLDAGRPERETY